MNIVTICVSGDHLQAPSGNSDRVKLLDNWCHEVAKQDFKSPDAVLLPGGFFNHSEYIGHLDHKGRKAQLKKNAFYEAMCKAADLLDTLIIAGVDSQPSPSDDKDDIADQLCVAWGSKGIVGLGKKIFPPEDEGYDMGCYMEDYNSP